MSIKVMSICLVCHTKQGPPGADGRAGYPGSKGRRVCDIYQYPYSHLYSFMLVFHLRSIKLCTKSDFLSYFMELLVKITLNVNIL